MVTINQLEKIFENSPEIILDDSNFQKFLNGVKLSGFSKFQDGTARIYFDDCFIGIAVIKNGILKRDIILE